MSFFYKKTPTTSIDQFSKDFFSFPPKPLSSKVINNKFDILSLRVVGGKYYTLTRVFKVFRRDPEKECDPIVREMILKARSSFSELRALIKELRADFLNLNSLVKLLAVLLFLVILPFVLVFAIFAFLRFILLLSKVESIGTGSLGFFSPKTQDSSEIVVMPAKIKKAEISVDSVISHEHIHLMQDSCFSEGSSDIIDAESAINLKKFLKEEYLDSSRSYYYFKLKEVEARLHEIVLSYYRKYENLPMDYQGFLSFIQGCEVIGGDVQRILKLYGADTPTVKIKTYSMREPIPAEDLLIMLYYFDDFQHAKRFVCEALSVMYGNLLLIYGDSEKAYEYLNTVESQDFYYQIYGENASLTVR
ncbi:hypothetical protein KFJ24_06710 [Marinobacter sediminum]|uniref:hypothetical protein n=1 Tax=Marinobacter sediminum TaxID=256323 RepID=UPI00202F5AD2|nr:hypothetical protein [Marinobacter sediminum]MCM0612167.1 hypothetical protein [Marinobacter sediminum]